MASSPLDASGKPLRDPQEDRMNRNVKLTATSLAALIACMGVAAAQSGAGSGGGAGMQQGGRAAQ